MITGHIKNREIYPQQRSLKIIIPFFDQSETVEECVIKDDHTFTFRFQPLVLRDIAIETFIPYLLIRPGDSLHIEMDFRQLDWVKFSGSAGELNQLLYTYMDGGGYYLRQNAGTAALLLPPDDYRKQRTEEWENCKNRYVAFKQKYVPEPDLEKWILKGLDAEYYTQLLQYIFSIPFPVCDSLLETWSDVLPKVEQLFTADVIHSQLFRLASVFPYPDSLERYASITLSGVQALEESTFSEVLAQFMIAGALDHDLSCNQVISFENSREYFDRKITFPFLREPLLQKYRNKKNYLVNPQPLSDALLYGENREGGMTSLAVEGMRKLQKVVEQNAGKVILINFWSGCGAAVAELEPLNELVRMHKGKDVEFVSIAIDGDWTRKVADKLQLDGQTYFWSVEDLRQIMKNFQVTWSLFYLLIDQQGTIVDYGSHIRPHSSSTKEKIDRLLEK